MSPVMPSALAQFTVDPSANTVNSTSDQKMRRAENPTTERAVPATGNGFFIEAIVR
jgi:hypothetical protein